MNQAWFSQLDRIFKFRKYESNTLGFYQQLQNLPLFTTSINIHAFSQILSFILILIYMSAQISIQHETVRTYGLQS